MALGGGRERDLGHGDRTRGAHFRRGQIHRGCLDHRDRGTAYVYGVNPLNKQYEREVQAFEASATEEKMNIRTNRVVVFVDYYDLATERALQYCNTLNAYSTRAVHFDIDPLVTKRLESRWGAPGTASASIGLEIVECEDRRLDRAALELVADVVRDRTCSAW